MKRKNFKSDVCNESLGEINFTNKKIRRNIKYVLKIIIFVFISVLSGILSSILIVDYRYNRGIQNNDSNKNFMYSNDDFFKLNKQYQQDDISWIVDKLKLSLVTIAKNSTDFKENPDSILCTGVVFDDDGHIITNLSSIKGMKELFIKPSSHASTPIKAECIIENEKMNIAVLKTDNSDLPSIKVADCKNVRPGESVMAMGNTIGKEDSSFVSRGIVSSIDNSNAYVDLNGVTTSFKIFKTDADINKYNSGGVLANSIGEVIGINTGKLSQEKEEASVGLAVSADDVITIIEKLKSEPQTESKEVLGFVGGELKNSNSSEIQGIYIQEVIANGPLGNAGIKPTDIILEFEDNKVTSRKQLLEFINKYKSQNNVKIKIWRNGEVSTHDVVLNK